MDFEIKPSPLNTPVLLSSKVAEALAAADWVNMDFPVVPLKAAPRTPYSRTPARRKGRVAAYFSSCSTQHLRRLEENGEFSRRVRIGKNRIAWLHSEVEQWLDNRLGGR